MNCEKNAVVCEGYPEKQIWKSGKERAEEGRQSLSPLSMLFVLTSSFRTSQVTQRHVHYDAAHLPRARDG